MKMIDSMRLRFNEYLDQHKIQYTHDTVTCPCCGNPVPFGDGFWSNCVCGAEGGDIVCYEMARSHCSAEQAVENILQHLKMMRTELEIIPYRELASRTFEPVNYLVDGLISQGLSILAGAPKVGKSWFVLALAAAVSAGEPFLGRKTTPCNVLYLALEDTPERLQRRFGALAHDVNCGVGFNVSAPRLGNGLEECLENAIQADPNLKLIIIDTLQLIRESNGDKYSYSEDYICLAKLKAIADAHGITILVVHHTRKAGASDVFDTVSGTNGITGAADSMMVLAKASRTGNRATLTITGRDIESDELNLAFNADTLQWEYLGSAAEQNSAKDHALLSAVSNYVQSVESWVGTAADLANNLKGIDPACDYQPNVLVRRLNSYSPSLLSEYSVGYYNSNKTITLMYLSEDTSNEEE